MAHARPLLPRRRPRRLVRRRVLDRTAVSLLVVVAASLLTGGLSAQVLSVQSITPTAVLSDGSTSITIYGSGMTSTTTISIGGKSLVNPRFLQILPVGVDSGIAGLAPALDPGEEPGPRPMIVFRGRGDFLRLENAVTYYEPLRVNSFGPSESAYFGSTVFEIQGSGFTDSSEVMIGSRSLSGRTLVIEPTRIRGPIPSIVWPGSPVRVDITVLHDASDQSATLSNALTYIGPFAVTDVSPSVASPTATTGITITGTAFSQQTEFRLQDSTTGELAAELESSWLSARRATATVPAGLAAGLYDLTALDAAGGGQPGKLSSTLEGALTVTRPATITAIEPLDVEPYQRVVIEGMGFDPSTTILFGPRPLVDPQVNGEGTEITALAPYPEQFGTNTVSIVDRGTAMPTDFRVEYDLRLLCRSPIPASIVSETFLRGDVDQNGRIDQCDARVLASVVASAGADGVDPTTLDCPDAADVDDNGVVDRYDVALLHSVRVDGAAIPPPGALCGVDPTEDSLPACRYDLCALTIESAEPYHVSSLGDEEITIRGSGFTRATEFSLENAGEPVFLETRFAGDGVVTATLPPHAYGLVSIVARETRTGATHRLDNAIEFVSADAPGPQEVEATLVDGVVEFSWRNLFPTSQIHIYRNGRFQATIDGDRTFYADPTPVEGSCASYNLVAEYDDNQYFLFPSGMGEFEAVTPTCLPPLDHGSADRGDKDFLVFGRHEPFGSGRKIKNGPNVHHQYQPVEIRRQATETAAEAHLIDPFDYEPTAPNELISGFTLFEPAAKLRFEVHGSKIASGPELTLRLLIESVTEGVDRVQELTLPDTFVQTSHEWIEVTYNTELPPAPGSPLPDPRAQPHDPLPPADYRVKLYAVDGVEGQAHYSISSDFSTDQILVPDVGCPPYPLIRVTDISGGNANPIIESVVQSGDPIVVGDDLLVTLHAKVVDPDVPADPIVKYHWSVVSAGVTDCVTAASNITCKFPSYGYYRVNLKVQDQRCGTSSREFVVQVRPPCIPLPPGDGPNFTFPVPDPRKSHFVTNIPGGMDRFDAPVPGEYTVFVVDPAGCDPSEVPQTNAVEFGLFRIPQITHICPATVSAGLLLDFTDGTPARVRGCLVDFDGATLEEECLFGEDVLDAKSATSAARFWRAIFPDMSLLPDLGDTRIALAARGHANASATSSSSGWGPWRTVDLFDFQTKQRVCNSHRLNVYTKPDYLDDPVAFTTGTYEEKTQTYVFQVGSVPPGQGGAPGEPTPPLQVPIGDFAADLAPMDNDVGSVGQDSTLTFKAGVWDLTSLRASVQGTTLGGNLGGSRELLGGGSSRKGLLKGNSEEETDYGEFDLTNLSYDYCTAEVLFDESFNSTIFNSSIYCCSIGPVPVTIWATVTFGADISLATQFDFHLRGFPGPGEHPFEANFYLLPDAGLRLGASIRADILFGVLSIEGGLDFATTFGMPFHIGVDETGLVGPEMVLEIRMRLALWFEACALWVLCHREELPILFDPNDDSLGRLLVDYGFPDDSLTADDVRPPGGLCLDEKSIEKSVGALKGGADPNNVLLSNEDYQLSIAASPDGERQIAVGRFFGSGLWRVGSILRTEGSGAWQWPPQFVRPVPAQWDEYLGPAGSPQVWDGPQVSFVDNETVVLAWTHDFSQEDPVVRAALDDGDTEFTDSVDGINRVMKRREIVYMSGTWIPDSQTLGDGPRIDWDPIVRLTDDDPASGGLRADGQVAIAPIPGENAFWVSWVRYEVEDPVDQVTPDEDGNDGAVNLRATGIFATKVELGGSPNPLFWVSGDNGRIDIQPCVAVARDGTACIVWLSDPDPTHDDLLADNSGRRILFSKFNGSSWSAPAPIVEDNGGYPAMLEPELAVFNPGHGLLTFTALPQGTDPGDSGYGTTRLLYTVKLSGGAANPVWEDPVLIYKKCDTPIFARAGRPTFIPDWEFESILPDFLLLIEEVGPVGTREGSGNILAMSYDSRSDSFGEAVNLTPDDRVHTHMAGTPTADGEIVLVHQSPYPSLKEKAIAELRRKGPSVPTDVFGGTLYSGVMAQSFEQVADPAISYCRISDPYAGPGAAITATVGIRNNGFASTPSEFYLMISYESQEFGREPVAEVLLPRIAVGEEIHLAPIDLTMPRHPVRIIAEADHVPGEINPLDNVRNCPLGSQPPRDLTCQFLESSGARAVRLRWENGSLYDRVFVYRDGGMVTELPGDARTFVDTEIGSRIAEGAVDSHTYTVRGELGQSLSDAALSCSVEIPDVSEEPRFRRGDADGSGALDVTDAVVTLTHLFLGAFDPPCLDAVDIDDSGKLDVTDPVFSLTFQFLGGVTIPPPGVESCGVDPSRDGDVEDLGCVDYPAGSCPAR